MPIKEMFPSYINSLFLTRSDLIYETKEPGAIQNYMKVDIRKRGGKEGS